MIQSQEQLLLRIKNLGIENVLVNPSVDDENEFVNSLRGPGGLISSLAKAGRIEDSEWLKKEVNKFRENFSIYIR